MLFLGFSKLSCTIPIGASTGTFSGIPFVMLEFKKNPLEVPSRIHQRFPSGISQVES